MEKEMDIYVVFMCLVVFDISYVYMLKVFVLGVEVFVLFFYGCCNCCCFVC